MFHKMKRFVAAGLTLALGITAIPTSALAADTANVTGSQGSTLSAVSAKFIDAENGKEIADTEKYNVSHEEKKPQNIANYTYLDYTESVEHVYSHKDLTYIIGYPDKTVRSDKGLTRAEAAMIFYRLYDGEYPTLQRRMSNATFKDVKAGAWYYTAVELLYNVGILNGKTTDTMLPNAPITRAEFAVMAARFRDLKYVDGNKFNDVPLGHWAYSYINAASEVGWIRGYEDGSFRPDKNISRVETISLVNGMINRSVTMETLKKLGVKNPYTDLPENHWGYTDIMEATVPHSAEEWHGSHYNNGKYNVIIEKFVDQNGKEIAKSVTLDGKPERSPKAIPAYEYRGYIRTITYKYTNGDAQPAIVKAASAKQVTVGEEVTYTVKLSNKNTASSAWKKVVLTDRIPSELSFVQGSVYVDGKAQQHIFANNTLTVSIGDIAAGKTVAVTFKAKVKDGMYNKTIYNTAVAKGQNGFVTDKDGKKTNEYTAKDNGIYVDKGETKPYVQKSADKKTAAVGDKLLYTVKFGNGKDAVYDIESAVFKDVIPSEMDFVDGSVQLDGKSANYTYDAEKRTLTVNLGNIKPKQEKTVTFAVMVGKSAYNKTIKNTAVMSGKNIKDTEGSDAGVVVGEGRTYHSIVKKADKQTASVGERIKYTLTISNSEFATVPIRNAVVSDVIPDGLIFEHGSVMVNGKPSDKYTYDDAAHKLTVPMGDIAPDTKQTVDFTVTVDKSAYDKKIYNIGVLTSDNIPETEGKDDGVDIDDGKARPTIVKTADKRTANVGDEVNYTITVGNRYGATVPIRNVAVLDTIPEGLNFVRGSVEVDGAPTNNYTYNEKNRKLVVLMDSIAPDTERTVDFTVTVDKSAYGKTIYNVGILDADNIPEIEDKDDGINVGDGKAKPTIEKDVSVPTASVGDRITYTIKVGNKDTATVPLENTVFTDMIPQGLKFEYGSVTVDGAGVSSSYEEYTRLLTVPLGDLAPDTVKTITFAATVEPSAYNTTIINLGTVSADKVDNVQDKDNGLIVGDGKTNLAVTKRVNTQSAKVGDTLSYTIDVSNASGAEVAIRKTIMTDTIPNGVSLVPGSVMVDGMSAKYSYDNALRKLTVPLENIAPDQTKQITFNVTVDSSSYGKHIDVNTAFVEGENAPEQHASSDGVDIEDGVADGRAGAKTVNKTSASVGDTITYTITLSNGAMATADWENAVVTDVIPDGLSFVQGSVKKDGLATTEYSYTAENNTLTLNPYAIAPDTQVVYTFDATVDEGTQGQYIVNTAILDDNGTQTPLPDSGVQIDKGQAKPIVSKEASVATAEVGDTITYTITAQNDMDATAAWKNVVMTDTLPTGVQLIGNVYINNEVALHKLSGNALSVLVGDIAAGESVKITFDVQILDSAAGNTLTNVVVMHGENGNETATDNGVEVPPVKKNPDDESSFYVKKDVDKVHINVSPSATKEQKRATFTITVGNNSEEVWKRVVLKDTLDTSILTPVLKSNVYVDGVINDSWSFTNKVFTLELGDIQPNTKKQIKITVEFKNNAANKKYTNIATAAGENGNITGKSPEIEIKGFDELVVTDIHHQLFKGYKSNEWRPNDPISLQEACAVIYRTQIGESGGTWLPHGTVTVPAFKYPSNANPSGLRDKQYTVGEESEWAISQGIVPAASFDVSKMTQIDDTSNAQPGKTWEINKELSSNGYLRIFPSGSDLDALLSHAFGKTQGWSATKKVTRLDFAKAVIGMQGRSAKPHTEDFSGHMSHFTDVSGDIQSIVTEVSHQHDYIMDTDGNEYWT